MKQLIDAGLKAAMAGGLPRDEKAAATQRWVAVDAARAAAGGKLTQPQMAAVRAAVAAANEKRAARAAQTRSSPWTLPTSCGGSTVWVRNRTRRRS